MIVGRVNAQREAIISVLVYDRNNDKVQLDAVVDTGFNHDLTLPSDQVLALGLEYAAPVQISLAGNVQAYADYYRATIVWDGSEREVAVLEMDGAPLVGIGLLEGQRLPLDAVPGGPVRIEPITA